MFRKILIATVASLSLLSPLAIPTESQAREVYRGHAVHRVNRAHYDFHVYIRGCNREAWRGGGDYRCREDALRAAHRYQERGLQAYVR